MKILLFGAFGQLGTAIREVGKEYEIDVVNTFVDISDEKNIKKSCIVSIHLMLLLM